MKNNLVTKFIVILAMSFLVCGNVNAGCDDAPIDGVDYSNCQFSEGQDLSRTYIPNSNLSFVSFIKVIFDEKYGEWLGCHLIGDGVTDMIAEAVLGRKLETTGKEILKTVHPHPTMSEALMESVADAYDEVIHL